MLTNLLLFLNLLTTSGILAFILRGRVGAVRLAAPQPNPLPSPVIERTLVDPPRVSALTPIKHDPIEGPLVPVVVRAGAIKIMGKDRINGGVIGREITHSYYQDRDNPAAEPFIATHYLDANPKDGILEPDMYLGGPDIFSADGDRKPMPGDMFRRKYEPANVAKEIGRMTMERTRAQALAPGRHNRTLIKETHSGVPIVGVPIE